MMKAMSLETPLVLMLLTVASTMTGFAQSAALKPADRAAIDRLNKDIPKYMQLAQVPGLSAALIRNGQLVWFKNLGVTNHDTKQPVDEQTIFEANSLSKPVFAVSVLTLVDQGKINVDTPIIEYEGADFKGCDDPRFKQVTTRMILSHSSGIVRDAQDPENKVALAFTPGEKFQYSPVGIELLSHLIEKITGLKIEDFIQQAVLAPLAMNRSSYVWQPAYEKLRIYRHDWTSHVTLDRQEWTRGAACCSLQTNAEDYAKFVIAVLNGSLLKRATWEEMLKPQIPVSAKFPELYWGLGWGLEKTEQGESFWHWGDSGQSRNYISANLSSKNAVILFTNSENGLSFVKEILDDGIGGSHQGPLYLDYERYDAPSWLLGRSILKEGAPAALATYRKQKRKGGHGVSETAMNQLGYRMISMKRVSDAIAVFRQNTEDFPQSWNTWDSLAEAYMDNGDNRLATQDYQKSLELNPANDNAKQMLKKLADQHN
jgi:CubicO group peptidase (beta-lactamase class C family)